MPPARFPHTAGPNGRRAVHALGSLTETSAGRLGSAVCRQGIPTLPPRAVNSMDALADPAFRAAISGAAFNRLPYLPPLRAVIRRVLSSRAFSYPAKVLRAVYPEHPQAQPRGWYIHYDYGVSGVLGAPVRGAVPFCRAPWCTRPPATARGRR